MIKCGVNNVFFGYPTRVPIILRDRDTLRVIVIDDDRQVGACYASGIGVRRT